MEFVEFAKIARLVRECVVTEKIDGTNAQVHLVAVGAADNALATELAPFALAASLDHGLVMLAGSRTRYLTPQADNFGFAAWVQKNAEALWALGEGRHFGEWWGSGINRGYGLTNGEKRFSLFNVARWHVVGAHPYVSISADPRRLAKYSTEAPACCGVVPVLYRGLFDTNVVAVHLKRLHDEGSLAAPGFMKPEGVVVFHEASGTLYKRTLDKDDEWKGKTA